MFIENCKFKGNWRKYQDEVLKEFDKHIKDKRVNIVAAPGSGKTILGLEMIRRLNQHVLILAPTITIRNQWKERFIESYVPEGMQIDFISEDVYNLNKFNVVTYQALHYAVNKKRVEDVDEIEEEEKSSRIKLETIDYNFIQELKNKKIKTIVLDEAHHLRAEWWKSLCEVIKSIGDLNIISLTATPPYDVDENEWRKYEEVCGTIDAEISVPELVATGDLCPHQDYVIFNSVTDSEKKEIKKIKSEIDIFFNSLTQNQELIQLLKSNQILMSWRSHEEAILSEAEYYSSILIYLKSAGVSVDTKLLKLISDNALFVPQFDKAWAEILLKNILFVHAKDYKGYENVINNFKKQLEIIGCVEKKSVYLKEIKAIKKIMASSVAKMNSIVEIANREYNALKENLSMVVLVDYVRSDYLDCDMNKINKIGVVPIFRKLIDSNICNDIAILTGKLKVVPKSTIPYIKEQLEKMNIMDNDIFSDYSVNNNYVVINGGKKISDTIVKIVTECINLKKINIVIGTVALLGEGWDAPAVNSLILASYVGSFMLSNQMRGRAIRKSSEQNKSANIWHLASIVRDEELRNSEISEIDSLKRRFKSFVGISYKEDVIQNGIERLNLFNFNEDKVKKDYRLLNEETYKYAVDRDTMAMRWKKILNIFGGTNIKMVDKLRGSFYVNTKPFLILDCKKLIITSLIAVIIELMIEIIMIAIIPKDYIYAIGRIVGRSIFGVSILTYFLIRMIRHMNPVNYIKQIGKTVLDSMYRIGKIATQKSLVTSEIEEIRVESNTFYKVYLKGATVHENNLFTQSVLEVYSKIVDTRYVICINKKSKLSSDTYFNVPNIFDDDKNTATVFFNEWKSNVSDGELLYTRSNTGRKTLHKARKHSFSYNENYGLTKEASRWK